MCPNSNLSVIEPNLLISEEHTQLKNLPTKSKKSVSWAKSAICIRIVHLNDMPKEILNATWYDANDYQLFKKDCQLTISLARAAYKARTRLPGRGKHVTERGLEHLIHEERRDLRRVRRQRGVEAVLGEQIYQQIQGLYFPEIISALYKEVSDPAQRDATDHAVRYQQVFVYGRDQKRFQITKADSYSSRDDDPPRKKSGGMIHHLFS